MQRQVHKPRTVTTIRDLPKIEYKATPEEEKASDDYWSKREMSELQRRLIEELGKGGHQRQLVRRKLTPDELARKQKRDRDRKERHEEAKRKYA